jgi:hypothetical protein
MFLFMIRAMNEITIFTCFAWSPSFRILVKLAIWRMPVIALFALLACPLQEAKAWRTVRSAFR